MQTHLLRLGVVLLLSLFPAHLWSWGPGRGGGFHGGFHRGGFHGSIGAPGLHGRQGGPGFPHGRRLGGSFFGGGSQEFVVREHHFFFDGPGGLPSGMFLAPPPVFRAPFFCVFHRLGFETKAQFFAHLQEAHGIPPEHAWSFCSVVSSTQIGYFGR